MPGRAPCKVTQVGFAVTEKNGIFCFDGKTFVLKIRFPITNAGGTASIHDSLQLS